MLKVLLEKFNKGGEQESWRYTPGRDESDDIWNVSWVIAKERTRNNGDEF